MAPLCEHCNALERDRAQRRPHHGLVEMTSAAANRQGERMRRFMCLGCGARWHWNAADGWARALPA